ncbi:hypothetical protein CFP56_003092 [Quercus suber]|uniref:Uncharacterized protein n=1 Tax=Quercus suber TaxID=58331 RepID=A0AAW0IJW3_QUESU
MRVEEVVLGLWVCLRLHGLHYKHSNKIKCQIPVVQYESCVLVSGSNTSVKRECAGTGLSNSFSPSQVVQALNLNFDDMNGHVQPRFYTGFTSDHDAIVARRNALLAQQRRSLRTEGALNHEVHLPQEWTKRCNCSVFILEFFCWTQKAVY